MPDSVGIQTLSETAKITGIFLAYGAAIGLSGTLARRGMNWGIKRCRKRRKNKSFSQILKT